MKSTFDQLIGHMRAVVVTGVDMVYTGCHRFAENSNGGIHIAWRSEHARAGKLHCTVSHAVHGHWRARECEAAGKISLFNHSVPPSLPMHLKHWMKDSSGLEFAYGG